MKKVLLCDDEEDIRDVIEMLLEIEFDTEVSHASNGHEGIEMLGSNQFDLIICDMNMPKANGDEVYEFNKTKDNIPFLLLSGDASHDITKIKDFSTSNPQNLVITKPWKDEELFDKLRSILS